MVFENVMFVDDGIPQNDIGAAVLEDFKSHGNAFARLEGPVGLNLSNRFLVGTVCKLKDIATGGSFPNA